MHHPLNNGTPANLASINSDDYYNHNQYFSQMNQMNHLILNSNGSVNNPGQNVMGNNGLGGMNPSNSGSYFHTLQAPHNYSHQLLGNSGPNSGLNPTYLTVNASNSGYAMKSHQSGLLVRSPSGTSSERGLASSSSSSSPSSSGSQSLNQNHAYSIQPGNHNGLQVSPNLSVNSPASGTAHNQELHGEYEATEKMNSAITAASEHAEMLRQKQLRGCTLTQEEHQLLAKDRQRKDNHNMSKLLVVLFGRSPYLSAFTSELVLMFSREKKTL